MDEEIKIYHSWRSGVWMLVCGVAIAALGLWIIKDPEAGMLVKIVGGYGAVLLGVASLAPLLLAVIEHVVHKPYLVIWSDRLEYLKPMKLTYGVVRFRDVERFRLSNVSGQQFISVDYKPAALIRETDRSVHSKIARQAIMANMHQTGAIHNFQASGLDVRGAALLLMLTDRLGALK